jgi:hypothetical protein
MTTPTLIERLRNTPNWQRESYGDWKQGTVHYDRAPFEAAGALEAQAAEIERLTQDRDEWKQSTIDANTNARSEEAKRRAMQDERDTLKAELAALKAQPTEPAPSMAGEREPLTLEKIADLNCVSIDRLDYDVFELDQESVIDFARAVEAAHGITQGEKV